MALLTILTYPDPRLHTVAKPVAVVDERIRQLIADMTETMYDSKGIGLAATQVDVHERVIVIDVSEEHNQPRALINPVIEPLSRPESGTEGCLSFPGLSSEIERPAEVRVKTMLLDGSTLEFEAGGLLARAVQHEHDHLHGVLFIDRMAESSRQKLAPALDKMLKRNAL
ncbi:MAG: peptide deformylase [Chthoniobacterales bacterium]